jgi:xanthine dehydrogenase iron-sulfur cluster and FAD-binding subunit A
MLHPFVSLTPTKSEAITRAAALLLLFALTPAFAKTPEHSVKIRIINAQTNQPITDEKLNVALRVDQIGSVAMPTDKDGIIEVNTGHATIIRILSNMYGDCRSRGELYTNYSISEIRNSGITTGNLCSNANPKAKPGELILFETPKTYIPTYPAPPASHASTVPVTPQTPKEKP